MHAMLRGLVIFINEITRVPHSLIMHAMLRGLVIFINVITRVPHSLIYACHGRGLVMFGRAKRAPHSGVQLRFHVIYMCQFVCLGMPKCMGGITLPKNTQAQSQVLGG